MKRKSIGMQYFLAGALLALANCNNYGLLDKLENPGGGDEPRRPRIFVTNMGYTGDLGGITGADNKCLSDSANPMGVGNGSWKALLAGGGRQACTTSNCTGGTSEHIDWVLKADTDYLRPDGSLIARTNAAGIFTFPLNQAISSDSSAIYAWTGLYGDWLAANNCADWTSSIALGTGVRGLINQNGVLAINSAISPCNTASRLYCVEQ